MVRGKAVTEDYTHWALWFSRDLWRGAVVVKLAKVSWEAIYVYIPNFTR